MIFNNDNINMLIFFKEILLSFFNFKGNFITSVFKDSLLFIVYIPNTINNTLIWVAYQYSFFFLDIFYQTINENNISYFLIKYKPNAFFSFSFNLFFFFRSFFKLTLLVYIMYFIFFIINLNSYFKQIMSVNILSKLFILNATEKEVGPVDDYFFFAVLFILTISTFIFSAIALFILQSSIYTWALGGFFLLMFLILTIPVNLFIDFGIIFCTVIRGSASGNNFIKELVFDIISTITVFIRFVIQNIRFFFIFSGIFELLEWTISNNSTLFQSFCYSNNNVFINFSLNNSFNSISTFNYLLINSVLFILLYFYYILHLLFLLLVQITVYLGISIWLFFFLYSTKFLNKFDKFFIYKKIN